MIATPTPVPSNPRFSRTHAARALQRSLHAAIETHARHARHAPKRVERAVGNVRDLTANGREAAADRSAEAADGAFSGRGGNARSQPEDDARAATRHARAGLELAIELAFTRGRSFGRRGKDRRGPKYRQEGGDDDELSGHFAGEARGARPSGFAICLPKTVQKHSFVSS